VIGIIKKNEQKDVVIPKLRESQKLLEDQPWLVDKNVWI
jgi:hypothetical protein